MRFLILIFGYLIVVLLPLFLSWALDGPPRPVRQELASGLGILAFSIILVEFVLSGRFRSISSGVGMDVTMRLHQLMARTALVFAMVHPFLYGGTIAGGHRPWDPSRQLTWSADFSDLVSGMAAFMLLPTLVLFGIYRRDLDIKYETWRLMHGVFALLIALLLLHHAIYAGRYGATAELTIVWKAMTAIAVGSLIYVYVIQPIRQRSHRWRVERVTKLSPKQWELVLAPDNHDGMIYRAGQFAWLNVGNGPFSLHENPFSIASAPAAGPEVSFVIKELGDFTATLGQIELGTRAYLDGPYGNLTVDGRSEPGIALIAGGVGIAPMLGILRQMRLTDDPRSVRLIYGNRVEEQIVFKDELASVDAVYVLSEPPSDWQGEVGIVDSALLDRNFGDAEYRDWLFVLCGPTPMMDAVEAHLIRRGAAASRIISERFVYD